MEKRIFTIKHRENLSIAAKGKNNFAGHKHSEYSKNKISSSLKGNKHWNWKGSKTKYLPFIDK